MNRCSDCKYWLKSSIHENFGSCDNDNMIYMYNVRYEGLDPAAVVIEIDEGWGAYFGKDFGCVHHEMKELK